jgi:hypothetical protein
MYSSCARAQQSINAPERSLCAMGAALRQTVQFLRAPSNQSMLPRDQTIIMVGFFPFKIIFTLAFFVWNLNNLTKGMYIQYHNLT